MPRKYSINWQDDEPVSFEVDGIVYENLEQVPDKADRAKLEATVNGSMEQQFEKEFKDFDKEFEKDWQAHRKTAAGAEKLILGIFTGVAILKINREESASGRVVEIIQQREYVNEQDRVVQDYYFPVVEFVSKDGRRHTARMTEGSSVPSHEVGDEITVSYDPKHPLEARIQSFGSSALMWVLPGITGILGLGFLGAVLAVRKFLQPAADQQNELA
jgi:hypothetical protein